VSGDRVGQRCAARREHGGVIDQAVEQRGYVR